MSPRHPNRRGGLGWTLLGVHVADQIGGDAGAAADADCGLPQLAVLDLERRQADRGRAIDDRHRFEVVEAVTPCDERVAELPRLTGEVTAVEDLGDEP
jgi:hypothetical protein